MDLSFNEIQSLIQSTATELMETEMPKSRVLEIDDSESGFDPEIWRTMCELGWAGMVIPEEYGGSGNSHTDLGALYEVLGYFACPSPHLSSAVLSANAILEAGSEGAEAVPPSGHSLRRPHIHPGIHRAGIRLGPRVRPTDGHGQRRNNSP